ncbi:hypothetical protein FRB91_009588, partial [Serendipita sp. 411]
ATLTQISFQQFEKPSDQPATSVNAIARQYYNGAGAWVCSIERRVAISVDFNESSAWHPPCLHA